MIFFSSKDGQKVWKIKEKVSEKIYNKSADEINAIIKPNVEEAT